MGNKQNEILCTDIIKKLYPNSIFEKNDNREIKERPDFVFDNIGIEHFLIDSNSKKANSISRKHDNEINKLFTKYHDKPNEIDENTENIATQMTDMVKENINNKADFNSKTFENNFERIFNEHYAKIDSYMTENNLKEIHFLIEIIYQTSNSGYYINGNKRQWLNIMPLTQKIVNIMTEANNIDHIYILFKPTTLDKKVTNNCKLIKGTPNNIKNELTKHKICICDYFKYPEYYIGKTNIKIIDN